MITTESSMSPHNISCHKLQSNELWHGRLKNIQDVLFLFIDKLFFSVLKHHHLY